MAQVVADADENLPSGHESYKVNKGKQMDMQNKHVECVWSFKRTEESTRRMLYSAELNDRRTLEDSRANYFTNSTCFANCAPFDSIRYGFESM